MKPEKDAKNLKYYTILTYGVLPFLMLDSFLGLIEHFATAGQSGSALFYSLVNIVLCAVATVGLARFSKDGLKFTGILFLFLILWSVFCLVRFFLTLNVNYLTDGLALVVYLAWGLPTRAYFKKRKELFGIGEKSQKDEVPAA